MTTTESVERGLLDDIIANPEDDMLRLIYADWLEDEGHRKRAMFIRATMNGAEFVPTIHSLRRSMTDECRQRILDHLCLIGSPIKRWDWQQLEAGVGPFRKVVFRRGFISLVRCTQAAWLEHGAAICGMHPVERVEIYDCTPFLGAIGTYWFWQRIHLPDADAHGTTYIDAEIRDVMVRRCGVWFDHERGVSSLQTKKEAEDAMSRACILWARERR